jgi:hypothetical protein
MHRLGIVNLGPENSGRSREWNADGPMLPVEFARESDGRKITLVICPNVDRVRTSWVLMNANTVDEARRNLGQREHDKATLKWIKRRIGYWDRPNGAASGSEVNTVVAWALGHKLDAAVWTDLPRGFKAGGGAMPSLDEVAEHLKALVGEQRAKAEEYVRRAPQQVSTAYRRGIEQEFGSTYRA